MRDLFWLTDEQMARLEPFFPNSHGRPRVDDRRVLSGIIFVNRNGLRWRDGPAEYGPPKTLYNRWRRWSGMGVFARMMAGLAAEAETPRTVMVDATSLKAHRTASSLRSKKGGQRRSAGGLSAARRAASTTQAPRRHRWGRAADPVLPDGWPGQRLHWRLGAPQCLAQGRLAHRGPRL
jgi:transposase